MLAKTNAPKFYTTPEYNTAQHAYMVAEKDYFSAPARGKKAQAVIAALDEKRKNAYIHLYNEVEQPVHSGSSLVAEALNSLILKLDNAKWKIREYDTILKERGANAIHRFSSQDVTVFKWQIEDLDFLIRNISSAKTYADAREIARDYAYGRAKYIALKVADHIGEVIDVEDAARAASFRAFEVCLTCFMSELRVCDDLAEFPITIE